MNPSLAIEVDKLVKQYRGFRALDELSIEVPRGGVFGLLGPNGAGKTTLLRSLMGYIRSTSGKAFMMGHPVGLDSLAVRATTAYLPAEAKLFRMMRGSSVLEFFSHVHPRGNLKRAKEIAESLQLDLRRVVAFMSTGMRQKLAIACVLATDCELLMLDEPTANLDPTVRGEVMNLIRQSHQRGATVVLSSHILDEIEDLCDRAAIVVEGKVQSSVDLHTMRRSFVLKTRNPKPSLPQPPDGLRKQSQTASASKQSSELWELDTSLLSINEAMQFLIHHELQLTDIQPLGLKAIYQSCSVSS